MDEEHSERPSDAGAAFELKRLWPLAVLAAGFTLYFVTGLDSYVNFEALRDNQAWLLEYVEHYGAMTAVAFMLVYIAVVALSLPGGAFFTVLGGFLFGHVLGAIYVVIAATLGATILFFIAKTAIGDALEARMAPWLKRMEKGFQENALSYLFVLRLIPLFPFFVVNLVPAFLGVPLRTYFLATLFGIIPGTVVYAQVGAGLGSIFEAGETLTLSGILTPDVILGLVGLAMLSLLPIGYKKFKERRGA